VGARGGPRARPARPAPHEFVGRASRSHRSLPSRSTIQVGPLAQLVEQGTFNPKVAGSNPARPTPKLLALKPMVAGRVWYRPGQDSEPVRMLADCGAEYTRAVARVVVPLPGGHAWSGPFVYARAPREAGEQWRHRRCGAGVSPARPRRLPRQGGRSGCVLAPRTCGASLLRCQGA
jgi:hypothetical protein